LLLAIWALAFWKSIASTTVTPTPRSTACSAMTSVLSGKRMTSEPVSPVGTSSTRTRSARRSSNG
jgi:hypothetical protein